MVRIVRRLRDLRLLTREQRYERGLKYRLQLEGKNVIELDSDAEYQQMKSSFQRAAMVPGRRPKSLTDDEESNTSAIQLARRSPFKEDNIRGGSQNFAKTIQRIETPTLANIINTDFSDERGDEKNFKGLIKYGDQVVYYSNPRLRAKTFKDVFD